MIDQDGVYIPTGDEKRTKEDDEQKESEDYYDEENSGAWC